MSQTLMLQWATDANGDWLTFRDHDFSRIKDVGVYHIWCVGDGCNFNVRSGQGIVGARLTAHQSDPAITRHAARGALFVTWAEVPQRLLDRVERFLGDHYRPVEGDRFPDVDPLPVNLPGQQRA